MLQVEWIFSFSVTSLPVFFPTFALFADTLEGVVPSAWWRTQV